MTNVRLLPIVIAAGTALLLLKSVGLITEGGYVLSGASSAYAAGAAGSAAPADAPPSDPMMTDDSPTLDDGAPTLPLAGEPAHGESAHGEPGHETAPHTEAVAVTCPEGADPADCAGVPEAEAGAAGPLTPMTVNGAGEAVPLGGAGLNSEEAVLERLGDRRGDLDAREAELDMRLALIEAAEQRIDERTAALEALEARIEAMVEEKESLEEEQFVSIIAMYESMKPRDAAPIFNQLDMRVLLRVARAMSPRRMAPILAEMDPLKARDLTSNMAIDRGEPTIDMPVEEFANLPQIVGQ
ncbi:MAG TPA: hypothetical protein VGN80_19595 [Devosiaceae bacterium]|nr:hypothetical protein [Devosiaceae bacterium]